MTTQHALCQCFYSLGGMITLADITFISLPTHEAADIYHVGVVKHVWVLKLGNQFVKRSRNQESLKVSCHP